VWLFDQKLASGSRFQKHLLFNCTPREYRLRGKRQVCATPFTIPDRKTLAGDKPKALLQISNRKPHAFQLNGVAWLDTGPFSSTTRFL